MNRPFKDALPILYKIEEAGFEAYFVGGSVRDYLLNREIDDVDIATSATPAEIKEIFPKTIDVGIEHGTVVVLHQGIPYEVTTFRTESEYRDFRRPNEVTFIRSLKEDLQRRDFTMNAVAMDNHGEIIDPFQGQDSLKKKEIKTVGEAKERFHEDALRMMRALRFVSQLSFSIDPATFVALKEHGGLLKHIAVERILVEFEKLLLGPDYQRALALLLESDVYRYLPGFHEHADGLQFFLHKKLDSSFSLEERWVILLYYFQIADEDVDFFLRKWKLPVKKIKRIRKGLLWLKHRLSQQWTKICLYDAQKEYVISTERLFNHLQDQHIDSGVEKLKQTLEELPLQSRQSLAVSGKDLMDWYEKKGGPWIEEKLREIEKAVLENEIQNEKESIREWLFSCNQP